MGEEVRNRRRRRAVVTGLGVHCPSGSDLLRFWSNLEGQRVCTRIIPGLCIGGVPVVAGVIDDAWNDAGRCRRLAIAAARSAADHACLSLEELRSRADRIAVVMGTVVGNRHVLDERIRKGNAEGSRSLWAEEDWLLSRAECVSASVAKVLHAMGPNYTLTMACAAGNAAIALGCRLIENDEADLVFAGGADELSPAFVAMFAQHGVLAPDCIRPFSTERRGVVLSEGAALLVLESEDSARARGREPLARVDGYHSCADAYDVMAPHPDGRGAKMSMERALAMAGIDAADVSLVCAHGTGTQANDKSEAKAIRRVFEGCKDVMVTAPKAMFGHCQGAAGAVEAVACVLSLGCEVAFGTPNCLGIDPEAAVNLVTETSEEPLRVIVSNGFGFGGHASSLVFTRADP